MAIPYEERFEDFQSALRAAQTGLQSRLWTSCVALIDKVDYAAGTVEAQPATLSEVRLPDGTVQWVQLPLLVDVPLIFQAGGGMSITMPVRRGDEALILFAARNIDGWWQSGAISVPPSVRMHDLSDGFAIVGPRSRPKALSPAIASDRVVIRTDDNTARVELTQAGQMNIVAPGGIDLNGVLIDGGGNTNFGGASVKQGGKHIDTTHFHDGVASGGSDTNPVAGP